MLRLAIAPTIPAEAEYFLFHWFHPKITTPYFRRKSMTGMGAYQILE
jgi:hypothetical protein